MTGWDAGGRSAAGESGQGGTDRSGPGARPGDPQGFLVTVDGVDRIHFLDWGLPGPLGASSAARGEAANPVLLIHGIAGTAWTWAPVARRLRDRHRVVAQDLRGHGLSDAPTVGYWPEELAADALAVAEGGGLLDAGRPLIVAGHGFGAIVAAWLAVRLGESCGGVVLVDGGWEHPEAATGLEPDEFVRSLDEPPEVMKSMADWLADRAAFDPGTWDADQEWAARAAVVELPAGRVVLAARPHVLAACVDAMYAHHPAEVLAGIRAPIVALVAAEDEAGQRRAALAVVEKAIQAAGRPPIRVLDFPDAGHNLMRYRPDAVSAAIETAGERSLGLPLRS
jgi:pimeloyl-ACP methyl ester carboxylesterase